MKVTVRQAQNDRAEKVRVSSGHQSSERRGWCVRSENKQIETKERRREREREGERERERKREKIYIMSKSEITVAVKCGSKYNWQEATSIEVSRV